MRCCTSLRRHSSVVISAPAPFTSILPPSSTTSWPWPATDWSSKGNRGVRRGRPRSSATLRGSWLSSCQSLYFAQALNFQSVMATAVFSASLADKNRSGVPRPHPVGRPLMKVHAAEYVRPCPRQHAALRAARRRRPEDQDDGHPPTRREVADDLAIDPGNRLELARPVSSRCGATPASM